MRDHFLLKARSKMRDNYFHKRNPPEIGLNSKVREWERSKIFSSLRITKGQSIKEGVRQFNRKPVSQTLLSNISKTDSPME